MRYVEQTFRHTKGINIYLGNVIIVIIMAHNILLLLLELHNKTISNGNVLIKDIHLSSTNAKL